MKLVVDSSAFAKRYVLEDEDRRQVEAAKNTGLHTRYIGHSDT